MHDPSQFRFIGTPLARKEDARLITGAGRFSDDFCAPGQCWLAVVRSPHPHARIRGVDFSKAHAMPGVLGTYSGADCLADQLKPIPHDPLPKTKYDMKLHAPGGSSRTGPAGKVS
jgi:aerobic carbon-monoxide dehydrogenase large subunit